MGRTFKIQNQVLKSLSYLSNSLLEEGCQAMSCCPVSHPWVAALMSVKGESQSNSYVCVRRIMSWGWEKGKYSNFLSHLPGRNSWWSRPSHQPLTTSYQLPWASPSLRPQISMINLNTWFLRVGGRKKGKLGPPQRPPFLLIIFVMLCPLWE